MNEDMNDIELLVWIELRFGMTKFVGNNPSNDRLNSAEAELLGLLGKYREQLKISSPIPRIRMWLTNDKLNFMFFDKRSGKRILLGEWLRGEEKYWEH